MGHNKMAANGKLHSLQKIIFFSWRRFWNAVFALSGYRALPIGKVLLIPAILLTAFYLDGLENNRPLFVGYNK